MFLSRHGETGAVLRCVRPDGSETWQKQERHGAFFVTHDLTHLAVESILHCRQGFYGLIASGWSIDDTTGKGVRGALPPEAGDVEAFVGLFDTERASATLWTADEFNEAMAIKTGGTARRLTSEDLAAIRRRRAELMAQWSALPRGDTLELSFE